MAFLTDFRENYLVATWWLIDTQGNTEHLLHESVRAQYGFISEMDA